MGCRARETWHLLVHPESVERTDGIRPFRHQRQLNLTDAANHLGTVPARTSEIERGTRPNFALATAYR